MHLSPLLKPRQSVLPKLFPPLPLALDVGLNEPTLNRSERTKPLHFRELEIDLVDIAVDADLETLGALFENLDLSEPLEKREEHFARKLFHKPSYKNQNPAVIVAKNTQKVKLCPRKESNLDHGIRNPVSYPLNDEGLSASGGRLDIYKIYFILCPELS